jgi:predicted phosphodiesterase
MKIAVLSDIHANLQALQAVLADCGKQGVQKYRLLGDYVDYGANPLECIALLSGLGDKVEYAIGGNHDIQFFDPLAARTWFGNLTAVSDYTKRIIEGNPGFLEWEWLEKVAKRPLIFIQEQQTALVHGRLIDPYWGRFNPGCDDVLIFNSMKQQDLKYLLCGHSHRSLILEKEGRTIINPGSVGQPRNGIPKAQYAIMEGGEIELRQVDYDIDSAVAAIQKIGFPESICRKLCEILRKG